MTFVARVHNHSIVLPADIDVLEGAEVQVTLPEEEASGLATGPLDWMTAFVGSIDTLPGDTAEQHTERAHGRKRRLG